MTTSIRASDGKYRPTSFAFDVTHRGYEEPDPDPPPPPPPPTGLLTLEQIDYGMFGPVYRTDGHSSGYGQAPYGRHERFPNELPTSWDWYHGSKLGVSSPHWTDYILPWGQVFRTPENTVWNCRVQIATPLCWTLTANNAWIPLAATSPAHGDIPAGNYWDNTFTGQGASSTTKGIRAEASGGFSWRLAPMRFSDNPTYTVLHWWHSKWEPRPPVPAGCRGIFQAARLRLIPDTDPNVNLAQAKFTANFGNDHWPNSTGSKPAGTQISALMQPRLRYLTPEWQWFTGHTLADFWTAGISLAAREGRIALYPPPIVGATHAP